VAAAEAAATTAEEVAATAEAAAALAAEMETAMTESVDAVGPGNGNAHSRRLERRAAERRRQTAALEEPFEEPGAYLEVKEPVAGNLLGGQGGRGELEAGGTPRAFDRGKVDI
jgi:hypothetical protein